MAIRGPKPKPVELRQREGSYKPSRHGTGPIKLDAPGEELLTPPADLDETAQEFWADAVPTLHAVGLLSYVDRAALEMLSTQYARAKQAGRVIQAQGHLIAKQGALFEHPSMKTEREAAQLFLRFAEQYALTPVARTRLGLAEMQRRTLQQEMAESFGKPKLEKA